MRNEEAEAASSSSASSISESETESEESEGEECAVSTASEEMRRLSRLFVEMSTQQQKQNEQSREKRITMVSDVVDEMSGLCLSMCEDFTMRAFVGGGDIRKLFGAVSWCCNSISVKIDQNVGHEKTQGHLFLSLSSDNNAGLNPSIWNMSENARGGGQEERTSIDCSHGLLGMVATGHFDDLVVFEDAVANQGYYPPNDSILLKGGNGNGSGSGNGKLSFVMVPLKRADGSKLGVLRVARWVKKIEGGYGDGDGDGDGSVNESSSTAQTITKSSNKMLEELKKDIEERKKREIEVKKRRKAKKVTRRKRRRRRKGLKDSESGSGSGSGSDSENSPELVLDEIPIPTPTPTSTPTPTNNNSFSKIEISLLRILGMLTCEKIEEYEKAVQNLTQTNEQELLVETKIKEANSAGIVEGRKVAEAEFNNLNAQKAAAEMQEFVSRSKQGDAKFDEHVHNRGWGSQSAVGQQILKSPEGYNAMAVSMSTPHLHLQTPMESLKEMEREKTKEKLEVSELERTLYVNEQERTRLAGLVAKLGEDKIMAMRGNTDYRETEDRLRTDLTVLSDYARTLEKKYKNSKKRCLRLENALIVLKDREQEHNRLTGFLSGIAGEEGVEKMVGTGEGEEERSFCVPMETKDLHLQKKSVRISRSGSVLVNDL